MRTLRDIIIVSLPSVFFILFLLGCILAFCCLIVALMSVLLFFFVFLLEIGFGAWSLGLSA